LESADAVPGMHQHCSTGVGNGNLLGTDGPGLFPEDIVDVIVWRGNLNSAPKNTRRPKYSFFWSAKAFFGGFELHCPCLFFYPAFRKTFLMFFPSGHSLFEGYLAVRL
jgi:hypothetical protein